MADRSLLTKARIGVLMGGQSSERDVSLRTGAAVHRALCRRGYDAVMIDVGPTLSRDLQDQKVSLVFLALHGPGGEDGSIQGFLETLGIPYTGSGIQASAVGMHKETTKTMLAAHGIPVPAGIVAKRGKKISSAQALRKGKLRWPVVVKPASEGSTIGVTIVKKPAQWNEALTLAHKYDRDAMIEAYIPGHEVTVSLLGRQAQAPLVLPASKSSHLVGFTIFQPSTKKAGRSISVRLHSPPQSRSRSRPWRCEPMKHWAAPVPPVWIFESHREVVPMCWRSIRFPG